MNLLTNPYSSGVAACGAIALGHNLWKRVTRQPDLFAKTEDLVALAAKNGLRGRVHGRDWVLKKLISQIGTRRGIVIIHGPPGVGKTALMEEIAYRIHEKAIPEFDGAKVLRLKSEVMASPSGLIGTANQFLLGSAQDLFKSILSDLKIYNQMNKKAKIILFVDEIQKLFLNKIGGYNFSLLTDHLAELDEHGVILVGATSDSSLPRTIRDHDAGAGQALARRTRDVEIPEMTPKEAIQALEMGKEEIGRLRNVELTSNGVEAIVHLAKDHNPDPRSRLPDSAIKFLEEVAQNVRNQRPQEANPMVDEEAVTSYLHQVSSKSEPQAIFQEKVRELRLRRDQEESFLDRYLPILPQKTGPAHRLVEDLVFRLNHAQASSQGETCLIQTNSFALIEEAAQRIDSQTRFRTLSLEKLLALHKRDPLALASFNQALAQIGNDTLIVEEAAQLIEALKQKAGPNASEGAPPLAAPIQEVGNVLKRQQTQPQKNSLADKANHLATLGINAIQQVVANPSTLNPMGPPSSPIIESLANWILKPGHRSLICISSQSEEEAEALEPLRWPSLNVNPTSTDKELSPTNIVEWLSSQVPGSSNEWIEKLVFLVHRFWIFERKTFSADLCYQIFQEMKNAPPTDERLIEGVFRHSGGYIRKEEATQWFADLRELGDQKEVDGSLANSYPELAQLIEEGIATGGILLRIEGTARIQAKYLAGLIRRHLKDAKVPLIDFSLLAKVYPQPSLQKEYLKKISLQGVKPFIWIEQKEWPPALETTLKELHQLGMNILHAAPFTKSGESSDPSNGIVTQAIQQGSKLIQQVVGDHQPPQPFNWATSAFTQYAPGTVSKEQFSELFSHLLKESNLQSISIEKDLSKAYFLLYSSSQNPLSLDQIGISLKTDLQKPPQGRREIAVHLSRKFGTLTALAPEDFLYAMAPEDTKAVYRFKRGIQRIGAYALQLLWTPIDWMSSYANKIMHAAGAYFVGGRILSWIRSYWSN